MADDERPDERADEPDLELARQLAVEPLDELTRRRLVSTALREGAPVQRAPWTWRWAAAAAVALIVVVGGLALLTAQGGHDEPTASRDRSEVTAGSAAAAPVSDGDFGDLDRRANLDALRDRLASNTGKAAESQTADRSTAAAGAGGAFANTLGAACPFTPPAGADVLGAGTGTIEGRSATVYLVEHADGARTYEAVLEAPCEARRLP